MSSKTTKPERIKQLTTALMHNAAQRAIIGEEEKAIKNRKAVLQGEYETLWNELERLNKPRKQTTKED